MKRASISFIDIYQSPLKEYSADGNVEFLGHGSEEALNNGGGLTTDDAIVRPSETGITKKGCAAWKNLLVGRLDVGMGANHRADASIEHACQGDFFGGGFGMEIDKDMANSRAEALKFRQDSMEWIIQGWHERATLQVDDGNRR